MKKIEIVKKYRFFGKKNKKLDILVKKVLKNTNYRKFDNYGVKFAMMVMRKRNVEFY